MKKKLFPVLIATALTGGSLQAQESLNSQLQEIDLQLAQRQQQWLDAQQKKVKYDTIGLAAYRTDMAALKLIRKKQEIAFIQKHPDDTSSLRALDDVVGYLPEDIAAYDRLFKGLSKAIQTSDAGLKTAKTIDKFMSVRIGAQAPLFTAPDSTGQPVRLEDFKGKYVLLDFWASWCGPCREENPAVVKAWQQFKDRNFTVLSVSLDQPGKRDAWLKAVHDDQLTWQHVSDLQHWNNAVARLYAVRSIPQNFLIDPKGKIIAANLRGSVLAQKLQEFIK